MKAACNLQLVNVCLEPILQNATRDFEKGSATAIFTGSAANCATFIEALLGMRAAGSGDILLFGKNVKNLSEKKLMELRYRIGVHIRRGGLISNLKVVENVTLPLLYHSSEKTVVIFNKALAALDRAGYRGDPFLLPGQLSAPQRAAVGMARVFAVNPELVIFDRLGEDLPEAERKTFINMALDFHRETPDRTTLFIFPNPNAVLGNTPLTVLNLSDGVFK